MKLLVKKQTNKQKTQATDFEYHFLKNRERTLKTYHIDELQLSSGQLQPRCAMRGLVLSLILASVMIFLTEKGNEDI